MSQPPSRLLIALLAAWLASASCTDKSLAQIQSSFTEAQSFLAEIEGQPVISANWSGNFRPYLYRQGKFVELIRPGLGEDIDFYSPTPISDTQLLLGGSLLGSRNFDLFLYDRSAATLSNLTRTPEIDEGDFCVLKQSKLVSYRAGARQKFARLEGSELKHFALAREIAGFTRCLWIGPNHLYGAHRSDMDRVELYRCNVQGENPGCIRLPASTELLRFTDFFAGGGGRGGHSLVGVLGLKRGTEFRRPYFLPEDGMSLLLAQGDLPPGDIVEYGEEYFRVGLHGRYQSNLANDARTVLFKIRKIADKYYAVAASLSAPKTLAELDNGRWVFHRDMKPPTGAQNFSVEEIEIPTSLGRKCPALYFGPATAQSVVLWLHGGPRENVSPRFHPYFHHLNQEGMGVLALNYPGSVGWGLDYEDAFDEQRLEECLRAAVEYLKRQTAEAIVSWSISTGSRLQRILINHQIPISAVIDQAGFDNSDLKQMVGARHIPFLSIRGKMDVVGKGNQIDFWYAGGHDLTNYKQFGSLCERVDQFIASLAHHRTR